MVLGLWAAAAIAIAHDFIVVRAGVVVDGATVSVTVLIDQGDLLAGLGEKRLAFVDLAEVAAMGERIAPYLEHVVHLRSERGEIPLHHVACIDVATAADKSVKPPTQLTFLLRGEAPVALRQLSFALDLLGEKGTAVIATVHIQAGDRALVRTVGRGEAVELQLAQDPVGQGATDAPAAAQPEPAPERPQETSGWSDWLREGFRHIIQRGFWRTIVIDHQVPDGLDHILFVLGLFLLSPRLRPLLTQITAFTVAHSLTLGLSLLGIWSAPSWLIEPIIAASIAAVAIENIAVQDLKPWRWLVVFLFGLVHGLGFASALAKAVPPGRVWGPLLMMNLGVELGQITVIAFAAAVTFLWWRRPWYRRRIVIPAGAIIAVTGCWWAVQRIAQAVHASG